MLVELTDEERELAEKLGLIKKGSYQKLEFKIIKGITKCKLCGTTTIQFIRMMKLHDGTWVKQEELVEEIAKTCGEVIEEYTTSVRLCWSCRSVLMGKTKEELVETVIQLYNPVMTRQEIWKHVQELKGEVKK